MRPTLPLVMLLALGLSMAIAAGLHAAPAGDAPDRFLAERPPAAAELAPRRVLVASAIDRPARSFAAGAPEIAPWVVVAAARAPIAAAVEGPVPSWVTDAGAPPVADELLEQATPAAALPDLGADPVGFAKSTYDAVRSGRWSMVAGLILIGVVYAFRRWILDGWAWARSDLGGVILVPALALAGMAAHALAAGTWPDAAAIRAALEAAVTAIATYVGAKKVVAAARAPAAEPAGG